MSIRHNNQLRGFTLIELVVVIIILGIIAVIAAPKFLNIKSDAVIANLSGIEGSLKSANSLVYSKSAIQGQESLSDGVVDLDGETVTTTFGYIKPSLDNIEKIVEGTFETVTFAQLNTPITENWGVLDFLGVISIVIPKGYAFSDTCFVFYLSVNTTEPTYTQNTSGC
ncbi:prepilin-type N-terminal cleavage/methylation domain-containing protein [uncultured Shewanella sp.]|uniref:prepilin-type N-terminal cleavage/methylation domain-containing protein n=1 Tax=uncultured Shewanella sp. TaxID=173975 RepID=UPI00260C065D|nr:prepilin-type N-terminal cleavage/methylation domain-containing protein [uncultured Shewanella sp.]